MKHTILILLLLIKTSLFYSQTITAPNYALKSHETLTITKIEVNAAQTIIFFSIENQRISGSFCADRNIYLIEPDGRKLKLLKSLGIPVCPDSYKFKAIGEKLDFILTFPSLKTGTEWIDIIEDCNDNCFSFFGVTLNNGLNEKINSAYNLAERGKTIKAISGYKSLLSELNGKHHGSEGALYTDIITLLVKSGDNSGAREWYQKMISSKAPRLDQYIKNLNSRGIKF
jgi:hypothetical protein